MLTRLYKGHKYRIYPDEDQKVLFSKTFGCVRTVYNKMIEDKNAYYNTFGKMKRILPTEYKNQPKYAWMKEVDSLALANAQLHNEKAYSRFFASMKKKDLQAYKFLRTNKEVQSLPKKEKNKLVKNEPNFKTRHAEQSYTTNNQVIKGKHTIRLEADSIKLPKVGYVKILLHRKLPIDALIKSVTIRKNTLNEYYISIMFACNKDITPVKIEKVLGVDFSMGSFFHDSDNTRVNYTKYYRQAEKRLQKEQRKISHMQLDSNNRGKQRVKIAKLHKKVSNQRLDFLHKLSFQIANDNDCVCVEDLDLRAMSRYLNFGKSIHDHGFGMFRTMLEYKLKEQGKYFVKINKWFPSSKTCSHCGCVKEVLELGERTYTCSACNTSIDRDYNASINIMNEGIRQLMSLQPEGTLGLAC